MGGQTDRQTELPWQYSIAKLQCSKMCRYTHRSVNYVIVDIRIISENRLEAHDVLTRCEELQIRLTLQTDTSFQSKHTSSQQHWTWSTKTRT